MQLTRRSLFLTCILVVVVAGVVWAAPLVMRTLTGVLPLLSRAHIPLLPGTENAAIIVPALTIPAPFAIQVFAKDLGDPRVMVRDPAGKLVVSLPTEGKVVALPDVNADGVADNVIVVAEGLKKPHGIAFHDGKIYIAETDQVAAYDYDEESFRATGKQKIVDLPTDGYNQHFTRTLHVLKEASGDRLLVSVGSSCNVCHENDPKRASILLMNFDGTNVTTFAKGLRNSVFMATNPSTGALWATEMGRDLLGDDIPPDEINIIKKGKDYGWPICYGKNIHDTAFDKNTYIRAPCTEPYEQPSVIDIPAHSAPLGLAFVPEEGWPAAYQFNLFVAYHGSWNRSEPTGYKVVRYKFAEDGTFLGVEDFLTGFFKDDEVLGRPADILIEPNGMMFVSDDRAGMIYQITLSSK